MKTVFPRVFPSHIARNASSARSIGRTAPISGSIPAWAVGDSPSYRWLPKDELSEVLFDSSIDRSEFFIAAAADRITQNLSLIRGDCQPVVVPFFFFEPSGDGTEPDFSKVGITDFGRTMVLGHYEASTDAILYEVDLHYRKKVSLQRKESEKSFGASLLRLRKQRKLKRSDFPSLSAKTIARIERNEIDKPHGATLEAIAEQLHGENGCILRLQ